MDYGGKVSELLMPTYENVSTEFIKRTLYSILCDNTKTNFRIRFTEPQAMQYIKSVLQQMAESGNFGKRKSQEILAGLAKSECSEFDTPVMVIRNYKQFFETLAELCEENIRQHFKRTGNPSFHGYERTNCLEQTWLRMAPEDFNNPEVFLKQQVQMAKDTTFNKYDNEICLGQSKTLGNNYICVQNKVARTWDEASQEIEITIYDKEYYGENDAKYTYVPNYKLPVVRYGIYERDGRRVCKIFSIQTKDTDQDLNAVHKGVDRAKYKVNAGMPEEATRKVEPKNLIALSIFVNLLNLEGITDIEAQGVYALDYEFHVKRSRALIKEFHERWPKELIEKMPDMYAREKSHLERTYNKEDLISEIKTERFIRTFDRLLQHYPMGRGKSYPTEVDSNYHITIPKIKSKNEIDGALLQEMYGLVAKQYEAIEI